MKVTNLDWSELPIGTILDEFADIDKLHEAILPEVGCEGEFVMYSTQTGKSVVNLGIMEEGQLSWEELPPGEEVVEVEYYPKSLTVGLNVAPGFWYNLRYQMAYAFVMQVSFDLKTGSGIYRSNGKLLTHLDEVVQAALEDRLDGEWGLAPTSQVAAWVWYNIALRSLAKYMERSGG